MQIDSNDQKFVSGFFSIIALEKKDNKANIVIYIFYDEP